MRVTMGSHSPEMTPTKEKYARVGQATFGTLFLKKSFIWNSILGFIVILETKQVDSFN